MEKFDKKKLTKKKFEKKIRKFSVKFFFKIFFGYHGSTSNLEHGCEHFWGLGPLVWEEIENEQTVHKGLAKLLYRLKN
jgi:Kef-type K+ transport system membrane component KefB